MCICMYEYVFKKLFLPTDNIDSLTQLSSNCLLDKTLKYFKIP